VSISPISGWAFIPRTEHPVSYAPLDSSGIHGAKRGSGATGFPCGGGVRALNRLVQSLKRSRLMPRTLEVEDRTTTGFIEITDTEIGGSTLMTEVFRDRVGDRKLERLGS
jgi:hypothetical protein